MKNWNRYLLHDAAGDAGGAGSGTGSLLTSSGAGGANGGAAGGAGASGSATGGGAATGDTGANGGSAGAANTNWRSSLPEELQKEPSLQTFNDISSLAKSFIHAQRAIGADKIVIPGKHATDDDWNQVYNKLGLPKELKDYELKIKEAPGMDKAFGEKFKETAHKAGILPQQAQKLADWFDTMNASSEAEVLKMKTDKMKADEAALKAEWGAAYQQNLGRAAQVVLEAADPDMLKYLDESGLGNDPKLIKLLSKVGEKFMKEDSTVGGEGGFKTKLTPKEAKAEANKILADFTHPYHVKDHPNHKAAVQEVTELFQAASPQN